MSSIPDLITQWREKQISGLALMRGLVGYEQWQVRISEAATAEALAGNTLPALQIAKDPAGKLSLLLFSSNEAYARFAAATNTHAEQHFLTVRGTVLFSSPMTEIERIQIDPLSPYDIIYDQNLFDRIHEMAAAVMIERTLAALRRGEAGDAAFAAAREYKNYYLAIAMKDSRPIVLNAPDDKGRKLAAVFTADDTFDAFLPEARQLAADAEVQQMQLDGAGLFDLLQRIAIDGFVFNCSGPIPPVAFAQAAAAVILKS